MHLTKPNLAAGDSERVFPGKIPGRKLHKKSAIGSHHKLPPTPQNLRQRCFIFGEFVVSFTFNHISALRLSS
jgi:hypothetical protein